MTILPPGFVDQLRSNGIGARLLLINFLAMLILSLALGITAYWLMYRALHQEQQSQLLVQNNVLQSILDGFLDNQKNMLQSLALDDAVEKYVVSFNDLALEKHLQKFNGFESVLLASPSGITDVRLDSGNRLDSAENLSSTELFQQAQKQPNEVLIGAAENTSSEVNGIYFGFNRVNYFGEKLAYIQVRSSAMVLQERIESFAMPAQYHHIISDRRGFVIYASKPEWLGQILRPDERLMLNQHNNRVLQSSLLDCEHCYLRPHLETQSPWIVTSLIEAEDYNRSMNQFQFLATMMFTLISILLIFWVFRATSKITRPINLLTETVSEIKDTENLGQRVNWASKDELGQLASAFNDMMKKLQSANRETQNARLEIEEIVNSIGDPVIVVDMAGKVERYNPAVKKLLGYSATDFEQMTAQCLLATDQDLARTSIIDEVLRGGSVHAVETVLQDKHGERIHVSLSAAPIYDSQGNICGTVFSAKDIRSLKQAESHLQYLANHDSLTGLPNRMLFLDRLNQMLKRIERYQSKSALLFLDLDRFKLVNDTLGHDAGDLLLHKISERLKGCLRDSDTIARFGGDEFVILANDLDSQVAIDALAEKIIGRLREPIDLKGHNYTATTSIGICIAPDHGTDAEVLMKKADMAMYEAKNQGRNTFRIYSQGMGERNDHAFHQENALRQAIEAKQFENYYQLIVDARTRSIVGVEALIRWITADGQVRTPGNFLPVAEETGLIVPIGHTVLEAACQQMQAWHKAGYDELSVSVNVADRQFNEGDFVATVRTTLEQSGLAAGALHLELTEGILMHNIDIAAKTVDNLKALGIHISVDDFGTGYSSLLHLQRTALDTVKIDRSFVNKLPENDSDGMICEAITELGHKLRLGIVAEGVETAEQASYLEAIGVDRLQGYFFSQPLPAADIEELLEESARATRARRSVS